MEKKDNGGDDINLTADNPNLFRPEPIQGAPTTPPEPLDNTIQIHRDYIYAALGML